MSDTRSADNDPEFPGRRAAILLGASMLVVLVAILGLVARDNGRRSALETTAELTAVGDTQYFPLPSNLPLFPTEAVASFRGMPLIPTDFRKHEYHADDMTRVGQDAKTGCVIYQAPLRAKDQDDQKRGPIYFLKLSPTEYLKTRGSTASAQP